MKSLVKSGYFAYTKGQIELGNKEKAVIYDLPVDMQIAVEEQNAEGYKVTYEVNQGTETESAVLKLQDDSYIKIKNVKIRHPETGNGSENENHPDQENGSVLTGSIRYGRYNTDFQMVSAGRSFPDCTYISIVLERQKISKINSETEKGAVISN